MPFPPLQLLDVGGEIRETDSLRTAASFESVVRIGRPLWYSLFLTLSVTSNLIDFAGKKLTGGFPLNPEKFSTNPKVVLASVIAACGTQAQPQYILGESLVALHMSILVCVAKDRDAMVIQSAAEPLLSAAALSLLAGDQFAVCCRTLKAQLDGGFVHKGEIGELMAKLLILTVRRRVAAKEVEVSGMPHHTAEIALQLFRPLTVADFLSALLPVSYSRPLPPCLHKYNLAFSVCGQHPLDPLECEQESLLKTVIQSNALLCPGEGQAAFDFLLPCCYGDDLTKLSYILIQVKNKGSPLSKLMDEGRKTLHSMIRYPQRLGPETSTLLPPRPLLALTFSFGLTEGHVSYKKVKGTPGYVINPIGSRHINDEERSALKLLLQSKGVQPVIVASESLANVQIADHLKQKYLKAVGDTASSFTPRKP